MTYFKKGLKKLIIFGLNQLACDAIKKCKEMGVNVIVISSPRMREVEFVCPEDYAGFKFCIDYINAQKSLEYIELSKLQIDDVSSRVDDDVAGFSFDSPFIIRKNIIDLFNGAIFNEHGAVLPQGKGGGGFSWRIMDNDIEGQVVFHELVEDIDSGPIVYSKSFDFPPACIRPIDYLRYQHRKNKEALGVFLDGLHRNMDFDPVLQQDRFSSYMPRLNTATQGFIDWNWHVEHIVSFINAFSEPYEGAKTYNGKEKIFLWEAYVDFKVTHKHPFKHGIVFNKFNDRLYVASNGGTLVITKFHIEDSNRGIQIGDRLFTPRDIIEDSYSKRVFYTPDGLRG